MNVLRKRGDKMRSGRKREKKRREREGGGDGRGELARENIMNFDNVVQCRAKAAGTETK